MTSILDGPYTEILTRATQVLGSREKAERWMVTPALGLERRRPIDMLANAEDLEVLETFLGRIEYGVYH
ncbi:MULTISPECIES: antitoxin Xre/MbcA/ParS toxin-binding domain-containing protein [unclassified Pseudomonas]|uniref:antitoxin Xre/MbcA/ParS toxin-binding domain-containing protein n=1 Tax=unclassified Pseudomonas TaxID=196821 RepID=UPI0024550A47|nr:MULTISPECIES: antitoxin Xre/MbcA/ParS toxin-binding domain-containing protein [unclassified Pseudomonas]